MSITDLVPEFYVDLPEDTFRKAKLVGQFCWAPIPIIMGVPMILDVERADPTEHGAVKGEIRLLNRTDFRKKNRLPIKSLGLRETEEVLVQRVKKRLAVIVSSGHTIFDDVAGLLKKRGQAHLQEDSIVVAPLYGVEGGEHHGGFPPLMVARTKALQYRQFFYCAPYKQVYEGLVRLDRIQTVLPHYLTVELTSVALSPAALSVLLTMVRALFGAAPDEDFVAMQELLREVLPPEARLSK